MLSLTCFACLEEQCELHIAQATGMLLVGSSWQQATKVNYHPEKGT